MAYEPMAIIAGCFHDIKEAFELDQDSQSKAENQLIRNLTISKDIKAIADLQSPYRLQVKDIFVPTGFANPLFITVNKIPDLNLYFMDYLLSQGWDENTIEKEPWRVGMVCVGCRHAVTPCVCPHLHHVVGPGAILGVRDDILDVQHRARQHRMLHVPRLGHSERLCRHD